MKKNKAFLIVVAVIFFIFIPNNLIAMEIITTIPVGRNPNNIIFSQDGDYAYVANWGTTGDGTISEIETGSHTVVGTIVSPADNHARPAVTTTREYLYVSNYYSGTVTKIRLSDYSVVNSIYVGPSPADCWFSPVNDKLYVKVNSTSLGANAWIAEIDTTTDTVTRTLPWRDAGFLALAPDGSHLYMPSYDAPEIFVVDTTSFSIVDSILLPTTETHYSMSLVASDDGNSLFSYCPLNDSMYFISRLCID